jgi:hypothetical protein
MERSVLHVAAPSLPWCFQWMASLAKKPKLPLNALLLLWLQSENVRIPKNAVLFALAFRLR